MTTPLKLPILYCPITPRGTIAFDGAGDPMTFTRPWLAIKAAQPDEQVQAFRLVPIDSPYLDG